MLHFVLVLSTSLIFANHDIPSPPPQIPWTFEGWKGTFDRVQLQRGFQVYKEICAACHSIKRIRFRELQFLGFTEGQIKALASTYDIEDGPNQEGEMFTRKGLPSDVIPSPYKNDKQAAAANHGATPPDLSLIVKARKGGANYIHAILTGYTEPPKDIQLSETQYYNRYFTGHKIAMTPPLTGDGQVTYADGTAATIDQMAEDVTAFLAFCAEPELESRKKSGFTTLLYLSFMTILFYLVKRKIWKDVK